MEHQLATVMAPGPAQGAQSISEKDLSHLHIAVPVGQMVRLEGALSRLATASPDGTSTTDMSAFIDEASTIEGARIIYHTRELIGHSDDPRRHWQFEMDDTEAIPWPTEPMTEDEARLPLDEDDTDMPNFNPGWPLQSAQVTPEESVKGGRRYPPGFSPSLPHEIDLEAEGGDISHIRITRITAHVP